jgi:hypothetical protein
MEAYLLDVANLLLRWVHVITAIAWIGSSFYFVFLDNSLTKLEPPYLLAKGVDAKSSASVLRGGLLRVAVRLCPVHGVVPLQCRHLLGGHPHRFPSLPHPLSIQFPTPPFTHIIRSQT